MKRFKKILIVQEADQEIRPDLVRAACELCLRNQAHLSIAFTSPNFPNGCHRVDLHDYIEDGGTGVPVALRFEEMLSICRSRWIHPPLFSMGGTVFIEVIKQVLRGGYDLVLKEANPEPGFLGRVLGTTDVKLLRKCPTAVWIFKQGVPIVPQSVLVAVDPHAPGEVGMQLTEKLLQVGSSLAKLHHADLHIVSAWDAPAEAMLRGARFRLSDEEVGDYLQQTEQRSRDALHCYLTRENLNGMTPEVHLVKDSPAAGILRAANFSSADILVMGTVGRVGIPGLLIGNSAEQLLPSVSIPMLTLKPEGFQTPVELSDEERLPRLSSRFEVEPLGGLRQDVQAHGSSEAPYRNRAGLPPHPSRDRSARRSGSSAQ